MKFIFPVMMLITTCFGHQPQIDDRMRFGQNIINASAYWKENRREQALKLYEELMTQTHDTLFLKAVQLRKGLLEHEMGLVEASEQDIFMALQVPGVTDGFISDDADIKAAAIDAVLKNATELKAAFLLLPE